ncbi:MAG: DUF4384 domain-containing protein [Synergistaceae bacterium]|jgi:hypothetical protein|nr:DUF4384 domain-containing protein [Synergistaceae bacterium]
MKKAVIFSFVVVFLLAVSGVGAWADVKAGTTTATRDIVLEEAEEEESGENEGGNEEKGKGTDAQVKAGLLNIAEMHKDGFGVTLTSDHADGVYNIGDKIVLTFKSEADAYLTILDFTAGGQILVLFPNKWVENNKVLAGQEISIPAAGQKFAMKAGGPVGVDVIKAIATNSDVQVLNPDNQELVGPFTILKDTKIATRDILLVDDDAPNGQEEPLKWSVASLAVMTKDPENAEKPTGFGVAQSGGGSVKIWTNGTSFLEGELVFLHILSDKPAKLVSLVNQGASKKENNLLPEGLDISVAAGEILVLPRKDDKWKLVAAADPGKDTIKCKLVAEDGSEIELSLDVLVEE